MRFLINMLQSMCIFSIISYIILIFITSFCCLRRNFYNLRSSLPRFLPLWLNFTPSLCFSSPSLFPSLFISLSPFLPSWLTPFYHPTLLHLSQNGIDHFPVSRYLPFYLLLYSVYISVSLNFNLSPPSPSSSPLPENGIYPHCRFVQNEQFGFMEKGDGERCASLLPATAI